MLGKVVGLPAEGGGAVAAGAPRSKPLSILVVSDDPHVREEARYSFPVETSVKSATEARAAWRTLHEAAFSAVVVDMQTGSAGGYALARDMSQSSRFERVPVVMLLERPQDAWLARTAGAAAYLVKPLSSGELAGAALSVVASSPDVPEAQKT